MQPRRPSPRPRPLHAWLLAALLLAAQALGLAHRVAHAPGLAHAGAAAAAHGHLPGQAHDHGQAHTSAVWDAGHAADTPECRLVDQLAHADGLCDTAWAAAPTLPDGDTPDAAPAAPPRAGSASAYLARAPPLA